MKNGLIVGLGEILWDVFTDRKILGGAPANFAYHASQLGFEGCAVSAVGNDELGKEIFDNLKNKQLKHNIEIVDFPTGTVNVTLDVNGIPAYEICKNVAWDNMPFTQGIEGIAKRTQAVCFGSLAQRSEISKQTIHRFIKALPEDAIKIFDINLRQKFYTLEIIEKSLQLSDILKINDEEVIVMSELLSLYNKDEREICKHLLIRYNLKMVILTKGTQGSYIFTVDETSFKLTPSVKVADTVGAGDSFTAAFIVGIITGKNIAEAHQLAVDIAAFVCTQHGAMPALSKELIDRIIID